MSHVMSKISKFDDDDDLPACPRARNNSQTKWMAL
jgi:hypothetical protein